MKEKDLLGNKRCENKRCSHYSRAGVLNCLKYGDVIKSLNDAHSEIVRKVNKCFKFN